MSKAARQRGRQERAEANRRAVIAWIHPGDVAGEFLDSVCRTILIEGQPDKLLAAGGGYISLRSGPRIAEARSQVVENFLTSELYKAAEWLFMVDSDMIFEPEALRRLVDVADKDERPIVGGLCFAGSNPENMYPTLYSLKPADDTWALDRVTEYPKDALVKVGATGAAALLVHRRVLTEMHERFKTLPDGRPNLFPWFVEGHVDHKGRALGEDIAFCIRAQALGFPVYVHTGIRFGHRKWAVLDEAMYDAKEGA